MVESEDATVQLSQNVEDHCDECPIKSVERSQSIDHGLTELHKTIISSCGLNAPKAIINFFQTHHPELPVPSRKQISAYKSYIQSKKCGGRNQLTITDLVDWCGENTREVMAEKGTFNEDTAYIKADINEASIVLDFVVAITTDRLVRLAPSNANVHGDDTHKVVVENFPFNVGGWSDKSRTFHPGIAALCSNTDQNRYARMFKIWKDLHGSLNPAGTLADAAEAIPNGAREAFGTITRRLMCYPHVQLVCFMGSAAGLFGHTEFFGVFQNIPKIHKFIAKFGIFQ